MNTNNREISVICKIQEVLNTIGYNSKINLPTIIVIGSQSSGKSSVLEQIVGVDFLPRGQGIVTRRPVIIQKIINPKTPQDYAYTEETGNISFSQLQIHLQEKMQEAAKSKDGITHIPVVVKLIFRQGISLSMIDMPGLTKIALKGQNENFPQMLENISRTYIQNPNSILLAISPANVDVANSDSLKLAREYDLKGERTIGVFTKMDLVEDPHTILKAFEGRAYTLNLGYYGVICRNQQDIKQNKTIKQALQKEESVFAKQTSFQTFHMNLGIPNLIQQLNKCLLSKIKQTIPYVKKTLENLKNDKEKNSQSFKLIYELYKNGSYDPLVYKLVQNFCQNFQATLRGGTSGVRIQNKIFGGAKINLIFENEFNDQLYNKNVFESVQDDEIYWTIKNAQGLKQNSQFQDETFELFAKKQVQVLKSPCLDCLARVQDEIRNIAKDMMFNMKELSIFNTIGQEILNGLEEQMDRHYNETKKAIDQHVYIQSSSVNQNNKHFKSLKSQIRQGQVQYFKSERNLTNFFKGNSGSFSKKSEVINMKNILQAYSMVIRDDLFDFVPKCIICLFIYKLLENLEQNLSNFIMKRNTSKNLVRLDQQKITNLQNNEEEVESLRKTLAILDNLY